MRENLFSFKNTPAACQARAFTPDLIRRGGCSAPNAGGLYDHMPPTISANKHLVPQVERIVERLGHADTPDADTREALSSRISSACTAGSSDRGRPRAKNVQAQSNFGKILDLEGKAPPSLVNLVEDATRRADDFTTPRLATQSQQDARVRPRRR